jgi:hypothetical protein
MAEDMPDVGNLNDQQMIRLLRAKAGELENGVLILSQDFVQLDPRDIPNMLIGLQADIALVAHLLAAHIERCSG